MPDKPGFVCPCFVFFVFFGIGLTTFIGGCNSAVQEQCPMWSVFRGTIYKTEVIQDVCFDCIQSSSRRLRIISDSRHHNKHNTNTCLEYRNYTCYNSYAWASKSMNSSHVCRLQLSYHTATKSTPSLRVGSHVAWYKHYDSGVTPECITGGSIESLWYAGVIFLSLTACPLYLWFESCYSRKPGFDSKSVYPSIEVIHV